MCVQKTDIRFKFGNKKILTIQKFDIHADSFLTETACNLQFKLTH